MKQMTKHGQVGRAATTANMDRKTARKYLKLGKLPSELVTSRHWRTRKDPFADDWPTIVKLLEEAPALEAKTIFGVMRDRFPDRYADGQLRTLQRHVQRWRATSGPDKEVFFPQQHVPGEAAQLDFTHAKSLRVTIAGELFVHMLCVFTLPFSNWRWLTVSLTESMSAIRRGLQAALFKLMRIPAYLQTDNSTAATHRIGRDERTVAAAAGETVRHRPFNEDYLALMRHFGMKPRTIEVGESNQNGDVEASNGATKRLLEQALLVRGNRDFETVEAWERFAQDQLEKGNRQRGTRFQVELAAMKQLDVARLAEFTEVDVRVSEWSTVRIKACPYSVPSRLIGQKLVALVYQDRIEVQYAGVTQLITPRLREGQRRIDYRHIIWSLVQKPGAFERYRYREDLFPSLVFRRAYDAIVERRGSGTGSDLEYLRILHLAATHTESGVADILTATLAANAAVVADDVRDQIAHEPRAAVPVLEVPAVDLTTYDALLDRAVAS